MALVLALLAALPAVTDKPARHMLDAESKELRAEAKKLRKEKAWPLAKGQVIVRRAEAKKGAPALVLVRTPGHGRATLVCVVKNAGPEAAQPNAVAERVWSFSGGESGMKPLQRWQVPAQLREGKLESGARGDGDNGHSAIYLDPQADGAGFTLESCQLSTAD
jgi:hypothetical protein